MAESQALPVRGLAPGCRSVAGRPAHAYTITELAQEFDITPRAIRFYEDVGLLTPARAGRNRVYTQRDRTRLKLTLRGKRLGLSLQEIKQLVEMYDSPSDTTQQLTAFLQVLGEHRRSWNSSARTSRSRWPRSPSTRRAAAACWPTPRRKSQERRGARAAARPRARLTRIIHARLTLT
jgi:DNA-binding transcriptional MerR regulator